MINQKIQLTVNGESVETESGCTIADLLKLLNINSRAIAVELNQEIQSPAEFAKRQLECKDCLEIVTLVGGG